MILLVSYNSCTPSSAQTAQNSTQDTIYSKSVEQGDTINLVLLSPEDTVKKRIIFKKDIKPIEVDTAQDTKREIIFKQLEKTEIIIQDQHKQIDSMIIVKSKKK